MYLQIISFLRNLFCIFPTYICARLMNHRDSNMRILGFLTYLTNLNSTGALNMIFNSFRIQSAESLIMFLPFLIYPFSLIQSGYSVKRYDSIPWTSIFLRSCLISLISICLSKETPLYLIYILNFLIMHIEGETELFSFLPLWMLLIISPSSLNLPSTSSALLLCIIFITIFLTYNFPKTAQKTKSYLLTFLLIAIFYSVCRSLYNPILWLDLFIYTSALTVSLLLVKRAEGNQTTKQKYLNICNDSLRIHFIFYNITITFLYMWFIYLKSYHPGYIEKLSTEATLSKQENQS